MTTQLEAELQKQIAFLEPQAVSLLQNLVRTPSITGNEQQAQSIIADALKRIGLGVDRWCPAREDLQHHPSFSDDLLPLGSRPVVVGRRAGKGGGASMILNGHIDVVPPGDETAWTDGCWSGVVRDGCVWGRGSCDMKGGLVSGLIAIEAIQKCGVTLSGDLIFESVIGEESGGVGTLSTILRGYRADAAIILEPTSLNICPTGAGALTFRLTVSGLAAHGAMRQQGVNAVEKFYPIYDALMKFETERHQKFQHPLYRSDRLAAPISIGKVQAGNWPSTVPESVVAEGRYGVFPGEKIEHARQQFEKMIDVAAKTDAWLQQHPPVVEWFEGQFAPAETRIDAPIVSMLDQAHAIVIGERPAIHGVPYGSDLRFFTNDAAMQAVLYGPGDVALAHSLDERVSVNQVMQAAAVVAMTILKWCA